MMDRLVFGFLALVVMAAPLPIGSNVPSAWSVLTLATLAMLALAGAGLAVGSVQKVILPPVMLLAGLLFFGVCAWILVQTRTDVPVDWLHPAWNLALPGLAVAPAPSLDPALGLEGLARLGSYAAMLALAFLVGQQRERAELLLKIILVAITFYAAFGLLRQVTGWNTLFGVELARGRASGPFVGPNIFGAYCNLGVVIAFCLLLWNRRLEADAPRFLTAVVRLVASLFEERWLLVVALGINLLASITSASRAGIMSLGFTAILMLALSLRGARWPLYVVAGLLAAGISWGMLTSGGETLIERLATLILSTGELDSSGSMRLDGYLLALGMIAERPILGQGYGTFFEAFHMARTEAFNRVVFDYLHSTWLEFVVEIGWPATLALLAALLLLLTVCIRGLLRGSSSALPLIGIAASASLGLHGLVDFAGQIPAVALTWACLMGLACGRAAIARVSRRRSTED